MKSRCDINWKNNAIVLLAYIFGLAHWTALLPDAPTDLMRIDDWRFAHYYYSVWQQALQQGIFPYSVEPVLQPTPFFGQFPKPFFRRKFYCCLYCLYPILLGSICCCNILLAL